MRRLEARLAELEALQAAGGGGGPPRFQLAKHCAGHPKQAAFCASTARQRTACCSRRAGKSEGCAGLLLHTVLSRPGCVALYLTLTRINAKRIIWDVLKRINREHQLGGTPKEAELCFAFPNGSSVYLGGVNTKDEIEKFRGLPIAVVVLDESQAIAGYLQQLVDEVLAPALMDYDGSLVLVGTPAPVPAGYFWECTQSPQWEHHAWTVFDNPWVQKKSGKSPREHLEAEKLRRGVTEEDASIQREYFGRWAYDPNALVFRYEALLNDFTDVPHVDVGDWQHVVAGDLGWDDADALAVLRWNSTLPNLWLVEEHVLPKQTITQLGERLRALVDRYQPLATVIDTGGLGKKIAEELTARWGLHVEAADKERKLEHIELLNDALRTGRMKARKDSRFAQDAMLVEWDKSNPEKWKISERYHSDVCDAVLYGYRRALQWLSVPAAPKGPRPGSEAWKERQARAVEREVEAQLERDLEQQTQAQREREDFSNDEDMFL